MKSVATTGSRGTFAMRDQAAVKGLQRAELARRTGCNLETIRYYEKVRLLPEPPRTAGGYRSYDTTHERRLRFVLRARELGFSLDEIRELLHLVDERDQPCAEVRAVAAAAKGCRDLLGADMDRLTGLWRERSEERPVGKERRSRWSPCAL